MIKTLTTVALICSLSAIGQTSEDHFKNGITKHEASDYKGAIEDYGKAIKSDKENKTAYFNRGICALAIKDYKAALSDFNKTIELDPNFANAYYSRATVFVSMEKYSDALPDLDKTIQLKPTMVNALTLRGQIRMQSGNVNGACEDFNKAKDIGDKQADVYLQKYCNDIQAGKESLSSVWPENENWKIGDDQSNEQTHVVDYIQSNEKIDNWSLLVNMTTIKGVQGLPMDKAMNIMYDQSKQNSPKAELTLIEKDDNAEFPWVIFIIESPNFKNDKNPESQIWYIVQGEESLYTNFIAIKEAKIPSELKEKWVKIFKAWEVINE